MLPRAARLSRRFRRDRQLIMRSYVARLATRALTPTSGFLGGGFTHSLNPYVGCAFGDADGCPFCYVRALPIARAGKAPWGTWVIAKSNLVELLECELSTLEQAGRLESTVVFMSSATDPYQGLERWLGLSRGALEVFVRFPPRRIVVQTRSPIVERDLDVLVRLGERLVASITLETDDESVRRALTPTSPSVARRSETVRRLKRAGIFVQVAISPMMPNHPERFAEMVGTIADRVIVDTYFAGDGSGGRRSRALGIGELYRRLGFDSRWFEPGAEENLIAALRSRLGADRVLFSCAGFNSV
jgi:DNA repair photolyase